MREGEQFYQYDEKKRTLARRYEKIKLILDFIAGTIVPLTASLLLVFSGISLALSRLFVSATGSYWLTVAAYAVVFVAYLQLIGSPFMFYSGFIIDHNFGLSTQRWKDWVIDDVKGFGLAAVFGVPAAVVLYYLIGITRLWWLAAAALLAVFSILLSIIIPYVIMPIFYKVTPLADQDLKTNLIEMSEKLGAKSIDHVLVADESRRSIRANAMFSGIGKSRAIILFDTLINNFTRREVVTVVAHELGHYVNKDIWKSAVISGFLVIPPFFIADYMLRSSAGSLDLAGITDPAGIPIIFAIMMGVNFLLEPISNALSRLLERQADEFALRAADDSDAQASAERRLADMSLAVDKPNRLVEFFFYSHPAPARRVRLAEDWKRARSSSRDA